MSLFWEVVRMRINVSGHILVLHFQHFLWAVVFLRKIVHWSDCLKSSGDLGHGSKSPAIFEIGKKCSTVLINRQACITIHQLLHKDTKDKDSWIFHLLILHEWKTGKSINIYMGT